ncbi:MULTISPECIES: hypothetical protein [Staphylococcus]|jgi:hypothetical protein|uniref:Uncharacterized protein n=4 Tax=root TaxID=1 RepID=A0A509LUM1_STAEP|nr:MULTISPECIES: hypothetical protein [Staphylococcus]EON83194.1 hypothetical protein H700_02207 [Staphylococcus epidermidis 41tr]EON84868.1 hypothetical protein D592_14034 [Staphylococcus epidermidis 36-1]MDU7271522.1 hypothetical protein [Staphylococcus lugdunensis]QPB07591.1 hypothetical protein PLKLOBMN_00020 [Staphylococcus phage PhiSepi-HH1]DAJ17239.1 MAG TPA: hypothetical protein [Siphoviridae sp. ctza41]
MVKIGEDNMDLIKQKRIKKELSKLKKVYKDIPKDKMIIVDGLINRAAFMRISLEDMELDIHKDGFVEMFSQSETQTPYERERPVARLYNSMNKNYQSIIKELTSHLKYLDEDHDEVQNNSVIEAFAKRRDRSG